MQPTPATVSHLEKLIAFPTVSRDSNLGLIEWVRDELARLGIPSRLTYDAERRKANLFATVGSLNSLSLPTAPPTTGGLVLSGHTDVVPVDGQDWQTDPFKAHIANGRLYGRGAADMKGFIAVVLATVPQMLSRPDGEPFHIALSYDEEVGCRGIPRLLADVHESGLRPVGCIVGEPTDMALVVGHKGASVYRCRVHGHAAHSALAPRGVNAIVYAACLITRLQQIADRLTQSERRHPGYDITHTTLNVGVITGGLASNIVAAECEFRFDIRHLAWTSPESIVEELEAFATADLLPQMRALAPEAAIRFELLGEVPPLVTTETSPLALHVARVLNTTAPPGYVGFGTEGGLFTAADIPTVVCGPGSIAQAHQPDEFITLEQLARCESFMHALIQASIPTNAHSDVRRGATREQTCH